MTTPQGMLELADELAAAAIEYPRGEGKAVVPIKLLLRDKVVEALRQAAQGREADYECQNCIGMIEHGCYCKVMGAVAPGGPSGETLCKRPVAFRVQRANDDGETFSKTEWRYFTDEAEAMREADALWADCQGLYVRDGTPLTFAPSMICCASCKKPPRHDCDNPACAFRVALTPAVAPDAGAGRAYDLLSRLRDYLVMNMQPGNDLAPKFIKEIDAALAQAQEPGEVISQLERDGWAQASVVSGYYIKAKEDHELVSVCNGDLRKLNEATHAIAPLPQVDSGREAVIEECAKIADYQAKIPNNTEVQRAHIYSATAIAKAIRALALRPERSGGS